MNNKEIGKLGEDIAHNFLMKEGYIILERNFQCRTGEIDIVARDKKYVVFIEVKARSSFIYGSPAEAVNIFKKNKIINTANYYIKRKMIYDFNIQFRFDVVEVYINRNGECKSINLIKDAFGE